MVGKHDDDGAVRRSGRQRKQQYNTLSESVLVDDKNIIISEREPRRVQRGAYGTLESDTPYSSAGRRRSTRNVRHIMEEEEEPSTSGQTSTRTSERNVKLDETPDTDSETFDIYSRIKRRRATSSKMFYQSPLVSHTSPARKSRRILIEEEEEEVGEGDESNQSFPPNRNTRSQKNMAGKSDSVQVEGDSTGSEEDDNPPPRQYYMREHRPVVQRLQLLPEARIPRRTKDMPDVTYSTRTSRPKERVAYFSPARRHRASRRKKGSSSTSSSDDEDNLLRSPEKKFERRSAKSLIRAKERFLPLNMAPGEARQAGIIRDRMRLTGGGKSCSDIDPMSLDRTTKFDSVGGLDEHLRQLKEMILFPIIYPEVFSKFNVNPPRGVLFYGPPGTGKTLMARALANECSEGERRVAFFMRKGADCLSKWVGESERQLRLLFDQAYTMRPSIIFFDEIDGLAPVRSSRQDQIHSSIVSTLLALMDGLDQRGEVIVIGATNRLDSIDPALRRPGRFDRELRFALPDRNARRQILGIHTKSWSPVPSGEVLDQLAVDTVNFCGADLKGLCTEAALLALRTAFPQIYASEKRLVIDQNKVTVNNWHFQKAISRMVPASKRNFDLPTAQLGEPFDCLLGGLVQHLVDTFIPQDYLPSTLHNEQRNSDYDKIMSVFDSKPPMRHARFLLCSPNSDYGASSHIMPAILHAIDHLPVFYLPLSKILGSSAKSAEETIAEVMNQALVASSSNNEKKGSILYVPAIDEVYGSICETGWKTVVSILNSWHALTPVLLLATAHSQVAENEEICRLFAEKEYSLKFPKDYKLRPFFEKILLEIACRQPEIIPVGNLAPLPVAVSGPQRELSADEKKALRKQEEILMRELRIFLREMLGRLIRDRRFAPFVKEVEAEDAPDYYNIIKRPMDLGTMSTKLDTHVYNTVNQFLDDVDLITANALEYNPKQSEYGAEIRRRACALRDTARALIEQELDPEFEERIREIKESRKRRGDAEPAEPPPPFLLTAPSRPPPIDVTPTKKEGHSEAKIMSDKQADQHRYSTRSHPVEKQENRRHSAPAHSAADATPKSKPGRKAGSMWCKRRKRRKLVCNTRRQLARSIVNKYNKTRKNMSSVPSTSSQSPTSNAKQEDMDYAEGDEKTQDSASSVEELPIPDPQVLQVDRDQLKKMVDIFVDRYTKSSFDKVQIVYADLINIINQYEKVWDRRPMMQQLQAFVTQP